MTSAAGLVLLRAIIASPSWGVLGQAWPGEHSTYAVFEERVVSLVITLRRT